MIIIEMEYLPETLIFYRLFLNDSTTWNHMSV